MQNGSLLARISSALSLVVILACWSDVGAQEIVGVLAPTPVEEHSCIAVQLEVGEGQPVHGLTWYHNDSGVVFPRLLLMEGQVGTPPDLAGTGLILADLGGSSLDWGQATLDTPVTSSTGVINAVFELPAWTERTGTGNGGGPGLGYSSGTGQANTWVSCDGAEWVQLHGAYHVEVSPVVSAARSAAAVQTLASLAEAAPEGWWTDARPTDYQSSTAVAQTDGDVTPKVSRDCPLLVAPNPFNPRTEVSFYVQRGGTVAVDVFDIRGRRVSRLLDQRLSAGTHSVTWEGTDSSARQVASGVYFVRVQTPGATYGSRVALVR